MGNKTINSIKTIKKGIREPVHIETYQKQSFNSVFPSVESYPEDYKRKRLNSDLDRIISFYYDRKSKGLVDTPPERMRESTFERINLVKDSKERIQHFRDLLNCGYNLLWKEKAEYRDSENGDVILELDDYTVRIKQGLLTTDIILEDKEAKEILTINIESKLVYESNLREAQNEPIKDLENFLISLDIGKWTEDKETLKEYKKKIEQANRLLLWIWQESEKSRLDKESD